MEVEAKFVIQDTQTYQDLQVMERLGHFSMTVSRVKDVHDTYLDTPDRRLLQSGYACRHREQNGSAVISLKSLHGVEGNVHRREEIETPLAQIDVPPAQWPNSAVRQRIFTLIDPHLKLQPLLRLEQRRVTREMRAPRLVAELSLDTVTSARNVYHELEIELTGAGTEDDLAAILDELARLPGLQPEPRSKFERALAALDTQNGAGQSANNAPGIVADDSMAEAARKTLRFHMQRMLANEAETRVGVDIEALHAMRVATRRMRTAFYVFADALDTRATAPYLKELKRAGRVLGRVRDLDVFREKAQAYLRAFDKDAALNLNPLTSAWDVEYARARSKLLKYLASERYARFKHAFTKSLELPSAPAPTSDAAQRVAAAVPNLLAARLDEFYTCKIRLDRPDADLTDYHQMRIVTKYLRYTLEYFREALGPEAEQAIDELKVLQNHLGALQDAGVAGAHLRNVIAWGTWQRPAEEHLRWTTTPLDAPDVIAYLEFHQAESRRLVRAFPEVWARYETVADNGTRCQGAHFTALIAGAIAALS